jgi:hypothetical protein
MPPQALRFSSLVNRLKLIGVKVVFSPPAPEGSVWLFGKGEAILPWARGPMYPMQSREPDDMIPARMVQKILNILEIKEAEQSQFWIIQEHGNQPSV